MDPTSPVRNQDEFGQNAPRKQQGVLHRLENGVYEWTAPATETHETISALFGTLNQFLTDDQCESFHLIVDLRDTQPPKKEILKQIQSEFMNLPIEPTGVFFVTGKNTVINLAASFAVSTMISQPARFFSKYEAALEAIQEARTQTPKKPRQSKSQTFKFTLLGVAFGLLFPVVSTLILSFERNLSFWEAQTQTGWLIWIIDSAPLFLGIFGYLIGIRQDELEASIFYQETRDASSLERRSKFSYYRRLSETLLVVSGVFLALAAASFLVHEWGLQKEKNHDKELTRTLSDRLSTGLQKEFNEKLLALDRMASRHVTRSPDSFLSWRRDAENYFFDYGTFLGLAWTNKNFQPQWIYPSDKRDQIHEILGHEAEHKHERPREVTHPRPISSGDYGFLSIHPTYSKANKASGYIVGIYRARDTFAKMLDPEFQTSVSLSGTTIYSHTPKLELVSTQVKRSIKIGTSQMTLNATPAQKLIDSDRTLGSFGLFYLLLGISFVISLVVGLLHRLKQKAEHADRDKNLILNEVREGIYGMDEKGNTTFVNRSVETMLGFSQAELIGKPMHSIIHHSHPDGSAYHKDQCPMYEAVTKGTTRHVTTEVLWRKNGTSVPVDYTASPVYENGQIRGAVVTFVDVTDTRASLEALKESEETLREAQRIAKIGSWSFDVPTGAIKWTKQMFEIFPEKIENGEPNFDRHYSTIYPEDRDLWTRTVEKCLADGEPYQMQFRTQHEDDRIVWVRAHGQGIKDADGKVTFLHGTCQDVTKEQSDQDELESQKRIAQQRSKLASIGELAAGVGHEINNPLAIANGNIERIKRKLQKEGTMDATTEKYFSKYENASERIETIVKGLRTFARSDTDHFAPFNMKESTEQTLGLVGEIYQKENIKLQVELPEEPVFIVGNIGRFQQALMNLLSNAKDALEEIRDPSIHVSLQKENNEAVLSVEDNGTGIPPELQDRIFDNFFTTKDVGKGTGMGLTLTATIIKEHDGKLGLSSEPGKGTRFEMRFPLAKTQSDSPASPFVPASVTPSAEHFKILVVDDEPELREIFTEILEEMGHSVVSAENGLEGLKAMQNHRFDCVFTDMKMPKMDGPSFLREIHKLELEPRPQLFAVTGGVTTDFTPEARNELSQMIDGYLLKPFNEEKVAALLAKIETESESAKKAA